MVKLRSPRLSVKQVVTMVRPLARDLEAMYRELEVECLERMEKALIAGRTAEQIIGELGRFLGGDGEVKKMARIEVFAQNGIQSVAKALESKEVGKGRALPVGTRRNWGGVDYVKQPSGDWAKAPKGGEKKPAESKGPGKAGPTKLSQEGRRQWAPDWEGDKHKLLEQAVGLMSDDAKQKLSDAINEGLRIGSPEDFSNSTDPADIREMILSDAEAWTEEPERKAPPSQNTAGGFFYNVGEPGEAGEDKEKAFDDAAAAISDKYKLPMGEAVQVLDSTLGRHIADAVNEGHSLEEQLADPAYGIGKYIKMMRKRGDFEPETEEDSEAEAEDEAEEDDYLEALETEGVGATEDEPEQEEGKKGSFFMSSMDRDVEERDEVYNVDGVHLDPLKKAMENFDLASLQYQAAVKNLELVNKIKPAEVGETRTRADGTKWQKVGPGDWKQITDPEEESAEQMSPEDIKAKGPVYEAFHVAITADKKLGQARMVLQQRYGKTGWESRMKPEEKQAYTQLLMDSIKKHDRSLRLLRGQPEPEE